MTRPLRLEFPGALYHITARGDRKAEIYRDDTDRAMWLQTLAEVCAHFNFVVYGFCQMTNHYHLLMETTDGNLSHGMRQLNGVYSQYFNRRHRLNGHLFQGRYGAILVQKEIYLLEVARYIVLNPVRANMVASADDWAWSSHRLMLSPAAAPAWLNTQWVLGKFHSHIDAAKEAYHRFVVAGLGGASPLTTTHHQIVLGDEDYTKRFQIQGAGADLTGIARVQRCTVVLSLQAHLEKFPDRAEAIARAYSTSAFTITQIAKHFNVSHKTATRAIKLWSGRLPKT
jgi:REP element-mobilizing transposase RayT